MTPTDPLNRRTGLLNVAKPSGVTSRSVVDHIQRLVRPAKVGHAGTLDPLASGVLVIGVGSATRLISYLQRMPKTYQAILLLGVCSETDDTEGSLVEFPEAHRPSTEDIAAALPRFVGRILQRPPTYSALKVSGRRAYDLARKGRPVVLEPRPVDIYDLCLSRYDYPHLEIEMRCGSGTYVRSLGRDLAESVGTKAVLASLVRTAIGPFPLADAISPQSVSAENVSELILPSSWAVAGFPRVELMPDEIARVLHGLAVANRFAIAADEVAAFDVSGNLVAIVAAKEGGDLRPLRCFAAG